MPRIPFKQLVDTDHFDLSGGSLTLPTGFSLDDIPDVNVPTVVSGEYLAYDGEDWVNVSPQGGVTDHGMLTGLADDDHSGYLLLAGRGGQTISDNIILGPGYSLYFGVFESGDYPALFGSDSQLMTISLGDGGASDLNLTGDLFLGDIAGETYVKLSVGENYITTLTGFDDIASLKVGQVFADNTYSSTPLYLGGSGSASSHSLGATDVMIPQKLEVDGLTYIDNILSVTGPTLTSAGTLDYCLCLSQTLNDTSAAAGSQSYAQLYGNIVETDKTGWDSVFSILMQTGGSTKFYVTDAGVTYCASTFNSGGGYTAGGSIFAASAFSVGWTSRSKMNSSADGYIELYNAAASNFTGLRFGGTSSSFPMWKRSTTSLQARLADDSAYCDLNANIITANNYIYATGNRASSYVGIFYNDGNDENRGGISIQAGADDGSGTTIYVRCADGDGDDVGGLANVSGTFDVYDSSDERTKENIQEVDFNATEKICSIPIKSFDRKKSKHHIPAGIIAQELQEVIPEAVITTDSGMLGVNRSTLIPYLIRALQEAINKIDDLEDRIEELEFVR